MGFLAALLYVVSEVAGSYSVTSRLLTDSDWPRTVHLIWVHSGGLKL